MLKPILDLFNVTKHHGRARIQTQLVGDLHYLQPLAGVALERRNALPNTIHQDFTAPAWNRSEPGFLEFHDYLTQGHSENTSEMLEFGGAKSMDIDVGILFADVLQEIDIPIEGQAWVMATLHQNLDTAGSRQLVQLVVELFEAKNIVVVIFFGAIECAKLAINIANIRVIDIAIDDIGNDFGATLFVTVILRQVTSCVREDAKFLQRPAIQFECLPLRHPLPGENLFRQDISIHRNHRWHSI